MRIYNHSVPRQIKLNDATQGSRELEVATNCEESDRVRIFLRAQDVTRGLVSMDARCVL